MESAEQKLVGFDIQNPQVDLKGNEVVGSVKAVHVGKIGKVSLTLEGSLSAKPLIYKGIDFLEKIIPGDQSVWANLAKAAVDKQFS